MRDCIFWKPCFGNGRDENGPARPGPRPGGPKNFGPDRAGPGQAEKLQSRAGPGPISLGPDRPAGRLHELLLDKFTHFINYAHKI